MSDGDVSAENTFEIPPDHPVLQGHFPGNPVVPGVMILEAVLGVIGRSRRLTERCRFPVAKFLRPVRPGQRVLVVLTDVGDRRLRFTCKCEETVVSHGEVMLGEK